MSLSVFWACRLRGVLFACGSCDWCCCFLSHPPTLGSVGVAKCVRRREVRCLFVVFPLKQFVNSNTSPFPSEDIFMECLALLAWLCRRECSFAPLGGNAASVDSGDALHFISFLLHFPGVFLTKPQWFGHVHGEINFKLEVNFLMRLTLGLEHSGKLNLVVFREFIDDSNCSGG